MPSYRLANLRRGTWIASVILSGLFAGCNGSAADAPTPAETQTTPPPKPLPFELSLKGARNRDNLPVLRIHVKRLGRDVGFLTVRFPEGIDASVGRSGKGVRFYRDCRSKAWPETLDLQCQPVKLPARWTGEPNETGFVMAMDNGMTLIGAAHVDGTRVLLTFDLHNGTAETLKGVRIWNCVQLRTVADLEDALVERTAVAVDGRFQFVRDLVPGFEPYPAKAAVRQRFLAYRPGVPLPYKDNPTVLPHPGFRDDPSQAIRFWTVRGRIDAPVIATVARDGTWSVATRGVGAPSVWMNPGISCQHADASVPSVPPGQVARSTHEIHFIEGGLDKLTEHFLTAGQTGP